MKASEERCFMYMVGGREVEAKGYSEYINTTINNNGDTIYNYVFVIRNTYNNEVLYRLPYTGTVPPITNNSLYYRRSVYSHASVSPSIGAQ